MITMQPIEADYDDGVLRPTKPLHLKQGERVSVVVLRRPDPRRWNLDRLARTGGAEDRQLAQEGLEEWATDLDGEKHH
jgi:predicted DNA-binding antitoxin AbrB/MazE fold protein